ncbi:MAG: PTPA-CTERM sorting domain-containing protein [Bacteroidaceae bacterium]|nr:PTPA-CTERM sorting domain-containing protein [Bacteroidaceae bacterium]
MIGLFIAASRRKKNIKK